MWPCIRDALTRGGPQGDATGYCHLNGLGLHRVPAEVFSLTNLVRLDLSNNELSTVPSQVAQLSRLEHLWLRDNPLQQLPPAVARCRALRVLDVSDTQLSDLPRELGPLRRVLEIDTSGTPFQAAQQPAGTASLMQTLAAKDTEQRLRTKLANKLREGVRRQWRGCGACSRHWGDPRRGGTTGYDAVACLPPVLTLPPVPAPALP